MAVQKQALNIPFGGGLDTKNDPWQVQPGKMLALSNVVFDNGGQVEKRNGFPVLTELPDTTYTTLTTHKGNLVATGRTLSAFSADSNQWLSRGVVQPIQLATVPLVRSAGSQVSPDSAATSEGLTCLVYVTSSVSYYQITDNTTGQPIVSQTALESTAANPRAFLLGRYFVITYTATVAATPHLRYVAIPLSNPTTPLAPADLSTQVAAVGAAHDGVVANSRLYVAWNANDVGGAVRAAYLTSTLSLSAAVVVDTLDADDISLCIDMSASTPVLWVTMLEDVSGDIYSAARSQDLVLVLAPTLIQATSGANSITSYATEQVLSAVWQVTNTYSYSSVRTDYLSINTLTQAGVAGTSAVLQRSVGLASKATLVQGSAYLLVAFQSSLQPSYFLLNITDSASAAVVSRLAYSNGGGYAASFVLPTLQNLDNTLHCSYLVKDLLVSVSKDAAGTNPTNIYTQTGVNLAKFGLDTTKQYASDIASSLHLTGGQLWQYDGVIAAEHGFHVWPEDLEVNTSTSGGSIAAGTYDYVFVYEWTDAAGNIHRSAPSVPLSQVTTGSTSTNTISVPTLRLTAKTGLSKVTLVGYRYSVAQPVYYQFTSITSPTLNNPAVDSVDVVDTLADSSILGNSILYTTGGVLENIAAPASEASALYRSRLWLINAEDENQLWYSKPVISGTPVEFSDAQTYYVAPTQGVQVSSGGVKCLSAMDDKLILFKKDALYYVTGNGPDLTGAQNDLSEPVFITGTVGCANPRSIVLMPSGLMFQSDKGIWLLGRDLSTKYIGAEVAAFEDMEVVSALCIPGTNQVRFTLLNGTQLMYDYYYQQWGTFTGIPALSSCLYEDKHTFLNEQGLVQQEAPGVYLDNTRAVLISFTMPWLKLTNLQGFQRAFYFYLLGAFKSPHKLQVSIAYDYQTGTEQVVTITPNNYPPVYGELPLYGSGPQPYGGPGDVEQHRVFLKRQKCQSVRISVAEIFDPAYGTSAGAGLTLSGINMVIGALAGTPKLPAAKSVG